MSHVSDMWFLTSADTWPAQYYSEETCFSEGVQTGAKRADRINVLGKSTKPQAQE